MATDDGNLDIGDLQDLISNNPENGNSGWISLSSFGEVPMSQFNVPSYLTHDMELEWFPNSYDDFLSLNDVGPMPGYQSYYSANEKRHDEAKTKHENRNGYLLEGSIGFTRKKRRTINYQKRKWRVTWVRKRCSHCEAEETPQWRKGPEGPNTLCNACGLRFKSGRLVAEYRPATSPTFDSYKHSNYHNRILKRRSST